MILNSNRHVLTPFEFWLKYILQLNDYADPLLVIVDNQFWISRN